YSFNKINIQKFLAVNFKMLNALPDKHIVDRYFETVAPLGVKNDGKGLDYFLGEKDEVDVASLFTAPAPKSFVTLVVGGSYHTKKIPLSKLQEICGSAALPIVIVGGQEDKSIGDELKEQFPQLINTCGQYSIGQSASIIRQSEWVVTPDTGMMHIAAAFN